jgi:hypothetical protein
MDMKEASAMTEASDWSASKPDARPIGSVRRICDLLRRAAAQGTIEAPLQSLVAFLLASGSRDGAGRSAPALTWPKAQAFPDLARFLRSAIAALSMKARWRHGVRQQPFPPGCRQRDRRSRSGRRDHVEPEWCSGPAGSNVLAEHADLPDLDDEASGRKKSRRPEPKGRATPKISDKDARKAAAEFEREQKRRDAERRKEEAAREKERAKRAKLVAKAQTTLDAAQREHLQRSEALHAEQAAIEKRV